jgi:hypothetical protein
LFNILTVLNVATMKKIFISYLILLSGVASAQNVGIGTPTPNPNALLHVDLGSSTTKGMLVTGTYDGAATIPDLITGNTRMMFYPGKAAFRAGHVTGTQWHNANVGGVSSAMGYNTKASGGVSTAMGDSTTASGGASTAMGYATKASGPASTAMGSATIASGDVSTAMGYYTNAGGDYSTSMGWQTKAIGNYSTSMGYQTTATGNFSTAMGGKTNADTTYATAMGYNTTAEGYASTAMGLTTIARGFASTAMGVQTKAVGNRSTAMGYYTNAKGYASTVMGMFNDTTLLSITDTALFIIGNGNSGTLKNAMVVQKNGNTGIGVSAPISTLHVKGTANFFSGPDTRTGIVYNGTSSLNAIELVTTGTDAATADAYVSVQRSGGAGLHISKPLNYANPTLISFFVNKPSPGGPTEVGNITTNGSTTSYNTTSDKRLKENITNTHYGLSTIMKLNVKDYNYISDNKKSLQTGLLAQDLYDVYPQAVKEGGADASTNPWMVDYSKLTSVLVKAVQEQQALIKDQQQQIDDLKEDLKKEKTNHQNNMDELKIRLDKLEKLVTKNNYN